MNYRNRMNTIRPPRASISCVSRPRCSVSIYPTGSGNTIRTVHAHQKAPQMQRQEAPQGATSLGTSHANAHRTRDAGKDSTRRRHRSAPSAHSALIAVRCCWAPRHIVIMVDRAAEPQRRRLNMVRFMVTMLVMDMARQGWAPHVGPPRIWTPPKHRRVSRNVAASHVVSLSTAALCPSQVAAVQAILVVY